MPLRSTLLALALLLAPALSHAQAAGLRGSFKDAESGVPVASVQVRLTSVTDTSDVHRVTGGEDGSFAIGGLGLRRYRLEAARLGYDTLRTVVRVTMPDQDAGALSLRSHSLLLPPFTVSESGIPAVQKADTTEYHAGAVRTQRDATAEDLVQKLPGVTMENGQIKAQGEQVQQVLVNGRPFFGSDPTAGMRNLPAEVVDRIQVYDRMSDQAEFSGFDDGQAQKTMNFILRDQKARFGKVYAGYGDQDRYQAGGNATLLRGGTRLTLIGMSNNVNERNFSPQDLFGAMGGSGGGGGPRGMMIGGGPRGPGGGGRPPGGRMGGGGFGGGAFDPGSFMVGQQSGVSTTHAGGLNYVAQRGPRLSVSSSVFINDGETDNLQLLARQYLPPQDSLAAYSQSATTASRNRNQRIDARIEWTPDSLNSVIFQPRLYFQDTDARSAASAANTSIAGGTLSAATSDTRDRNDGDNLSSRLTLRHRFARPGRNLSADLNAGHTLRDGDGSQRSLTDYFEGATTTSDTLDQQSDSRTVTNSLSARVAFTEPLLPQLRLQAIYNPSLTRSVADARTLRLDPLSGTHSLPDSAHSNSYRNRNTAQNGGLAMLYTRGLWRLLANASYQQTRLRSEQTYPATHTIDRTFGNALPSLTLTGNFANRRNLRVAWSTSTTSPTIGQLQNVVNNSNPLSLSTGNPALRPTYTHALSLRISEATPMRSTSRFLFVNLSRTARTIANATFTAPTDTVIEGVALARGTQLTLPMNLDESWNANLFGVYSRPTQWVKSILSLNGGGSFTLTPTRINGATNASRATAVRSGVVLASNISQRLDFTLSYWATYNHSRSTLSSSRSGDYFTHSAGLRLNAVVGSGVVLREELNHNLQSGVPSAYGQDVVLWNTTLGKKFLKGERGELRVTATDVLEQNRSVSRSVTETYVQDSRDRTLGRYVQAVFTYSWR